MKAVWGMDYDHVTDKCYDRPMCPECDAPVIRFEDGKIRCVSCSEEASLDADMLKWLADREGEKIEMKDCCGCGGKGCMETHYVKNDVTLEWQPAFGECVKCGMRFIV